MITVGILLVSYLGHLTRAMQKKFIIIGYISVLINLIQIFSFVGERIASTYFGAMK